MFKVYKNSRLAKTGFLTYEAARQWVRKQLRKQTAFRLSGQPVSDGGITLGTYTIKS